MVNLVFKSIEFLSLNMKAAQESDLIDVILARVYYRAIKVSDHFFIMLLRKLVFDK